MKHRSLWVRAPTIRAFRVCGDSDRQRGAKRKLNPPRIRPLSRAYNRTGVTAATARSVRDMPYFYVFLCISCPALKIPQRRLR
jgi:hypothetical protein